MSKKKDVKKVKITKKSGLILGKKLGLFLVLIGLALSCSNEFFCNDLCNVCSYEQLAPCYFLFVTGVNPFYPTIVFG